MSLAPIIIVPALDFVPQRLVIGDKEIFVDKMNQYMNKLEAWAPQVRANSISQDAFRTSAEIEFAARLTAHNALANQVDPLVKISQGVQIGPATGYVTPSANSPAGNEGDYFIVTYTGVSIDGVAVPDRTVLRRTATGGVGDSNWEIDPLATTLLRASPASSGGTEYVNQIGPLTGMNVSGNAPIGNEGDFFTVIGAPITINGVAVPDKTLIRLNRDNNVIGAGAESWDIDPLGTALLRSIRIDNHFNGVDSRIALSSTKGKELKDLYDALDLQTAANTTAINNLSGGSAASNIGPAAGYTANTTSPTGLEGDYFIVSAPITVDGVSVAADTVLKLNKDGGGTSADWDVDLIQTALLQGTGVTTTQMNLAITTAVSNEAAARTAAILAETSARNTAIDNVDPQRPIGPRSGYLTADSPVTSPAGEKDDFFVAWDAVTIDGVAVPAKTVLYLLNDAAGGTSSDWAIDAIETAKLAVGTGGGIQHIGTGTNADRIANTDLDKLQWYATDTETWWDIKGGAWTLR